MELGCRSLRPCDVCGTESAKWYCAADEAYLCERCDDSVHSANALAGRHDRVGMAPNGAPMKIERHSKGGPGINSTSAVKGPWQSINQIRKKRILPEFTKIAPSFYTLIKEEPLDDKQIRSKTSHKLHELEEEDEDENGDDDQGEIDEDNEAEERKCKNSFVIVPQIDVKSPPLSMEAPFLHVPIEVIDGSLHFSSHFSAQFSQPSLDSKGFDMVHHDLSNHNLGNTCLETLGVMDWFRSGNPEVLNDQNSILIEEDCNCLQDMANGIIYPFKGKVEREREMELEEDSDSTLLHNSPWIVRATSDLSCSGRSNSLNSLALKLNYEDILSEWSDRGSLWSDGQRPQIVPDIFTFEHAISAEGGNMYQQEPQQEVPVMDYFCRVVNSAEREARVMRYREKRQSRLFAKKVRYEVRKLNAERRPRMKGRFIKRTSCTEECTI